MTRPMDIGDIAQMLNGQVEALVRELLPHGVKDGAEWRVGSVHGEAGRSMAVRLTGPKRGTWCDFAAPNHKGDALDLVAHSLFAGDKREALRWARAWLGVDKVDAHSLPTRGASAVQRRAPTVERDEQGRRLSALRLFLEAKPGILGTPAEAYLAARAIHLAELGRQPGCLRFHPETPCGPLSRPGHLVRVPAMLAAITDAEGEHIATHRTFLEPDGRGGWRKHTGMSKPKMVLGRMAGGSIRLWRGFSGKPLREAPIGETLAVCEGIEDGLTLALSNPDWRVLAAVSVGNFPALTLPPQCQDIVLVRDRDGENAQAEAARRAALYRWREEGRRVRVTQPPQGFKDFNDWWRAIAAEDEREEDVA